MPNSIPKAKLETIRAKTFAILDERQYLSQSRKENGKLMDELVNHPEIGEVIASYMPKAAVKTYIKDALINAYSKKENAKSLSIDAVEARLAIHEGLPVHLIEGSCNKKILFLRADNGTLIVAGVGLISKWETALRKVLEFVERAPKLPPAMGELKMYLVLTVKGKNLTDSEKDHILNTLSLIDVSVEIFQ